MVELQDAAALVTGASSGIGEETVRALAAEGADVALAARSEDVLEELAADVEAEHGVDAIAVPTDVSEREQVDAAVEATVDAFGGLDVLVNNAGIWGTGSIDECSPEEYRRLMSVNADGVFYATKAALPHLREAEGSLIFLGSFAGQYPRPGDAVYAASKWWTRGFAHSLAGTVGEDGVAVTVVNPSEVRTGIEASDGGTIAEKFDANEATDPATIAEAIAFAAGESPPDTVQELDLYRRDKFADF